MFFFIVSSECQWKFKLPENDLDNDFVLRCDHFDVGRAQESGRCWGDALVIYGDSNSVLRNRKHSRKIDHLSLCGRYFNFYMFSILCIQKARNIFHIDKFFELWYLEGTDLKSGL